MNDIRAREVPIKLDKKRKLRYDLNAFAELEELGMGTSGEVLGAMEKGSVKAIRGLLWAGLIHQDPDLSLQQVGAMLSIAGIESISDKLRGAIMGAMPEPEESEETAGE